MSGLTESIEQAGCLQVADVIRDGVAAERQIPAERFVTGFERGAFGKDVHQLFELGCSGDGHLCIFWNIVLDRCEDGVLETDFGIAFLEERIKANATIFFIVFNGPVFAVREIHLALEYFFQRGGLKVPTVPDVQEFAEGEAGHFIRDAATAEVGFIALSQRQEAAAGIYNLKCGIIIVDILDFRGPAFVFVNLVNI